MPREHFVQRWAKQRTNSMDLTEAEILKRGGKNTQNYTKKVLMVQITMMV